MRLPVELGRHIMHEVALMYCLDRNIIRASRRFNDTLSHALFLWHMTSMLRATMTPQDREWMDELNERFFGLP